MTKIETGTFCFFVPDIVLNAEEHQTKKQNVPILSEKAFDAEVGQQVD